MGILAYLSAYFITGGNAILLTALIVIDEFFHEKRSWPYLAGIIAVAVSAPYLAYLFLYITPLKMAYLSLTPFDLPELNKSYRIAWAAIPFIYALWRGAGVKWSTTRGAPTKKPAIWIAFSLVLIFALTLYGLKSATDAKAEYVMQMAYEVERGNWDKVLEMSKNDKMQNTALVPFFTNIALSEKGLLAAEMFNYRQTGTYGLFNVWKVHYTTLLYIGEQYYRLGMTQEAEHLAYEAMIGSPTEYGSKALRSLVYTTMLRRDTPGFEKYIRKFEQSPTYRHWAKEQRKHYARYRADSTYIIPGAARSLQAADIGFIDHGLPQQNMRFILQTNKGDKKAFEYLIMFSLLQKDLTSFYALFERYYPEMNYEHLPRHIEEALLVYAAATNQQSEFVKKYAISSRTVRQFINYEQESASSNLAALKTKYGNTYFYYLRNIKPMALDMMQTMPVY
ncbi:hypothetical protein FACS189432_01690 [Bacteroidia bacterium]|nr:hypothetical protein FACS189426_01450 [Bacteroidia bacterium]GHT26713.1 hypothetical protein FACS189432_01690 [Bacteroidia bacterium]